MLQCFYRWKAARTISLDSLIITEYSNINIELLDKANNSKFVIRKWISVNDQSNENYDVEKEIIYNTEVLKSNLCDYNLVVAITTMVAF